MTPAVEAPCIDWFRVFADLNRVGVSTRHAAHLIGVSKATVTAYAANLTQPRWREGEAIVLLWCERTGKLREEVPTLDVCPPRYRRRA